jgi:hypothetical protein
VLTVLPDLFLQRFYVVKPTSSERKEEVVEVRATNLLSIALSLVMVSRRTPSLDHKVSLSCFYHLDLIMILATGIAVADAYAL